VRVIVGRSGRADQAIAAELPGRGRAEIARLFERGDVRRAGRRLRKGDSVTAGEILEVAESVADRSPPLPEALPLEVIEETAAWVAVAKPPGIPSHPLRGGELGTLANRLVAAYPECALAGEDPREAGLVHRLDAGTSGILVAARSPLAWRDLRDRFSRGEVVKEYLALVGPGAVAGATDVPLGQSGGRAVVGVPDAREARTSWTVVASSATATLLRCLAHTGRMHQIRAHLAHNGFPIAGDSQYGGSPPVLPLIEFFLHASRVSFVGRRAELPPDRRDRLCLENMSDFGNF
jgi:23S rRNA pseudouridine1911/1915/1917 synthase